MFEGLDDIDWASMNHAYGSAEDVPGLLRDLASENDDDRDYAMYELYGNIFHQGTRYEATAPAVPFLLELLGQPDYPGHTDILYFLSSLVTGYGEAYLPDGFMPEIAGMRAELARLRARPEEERAEDETDSLGWGSDQDWLRWIVNITDEVRRGAPRIIRHLGNDDEKVRIAATYLLSWLPEDYDLFAPSLWDLVQNDPSDHVRADALIALAVAADEAAFAEYVPTIETLLADGEPILQFASAIALGTRTSDELPDAVIQVLLETIAAEGEDEDEEGPAWYIPWYDGEPGAYAAEVLRFVPDDHADRVARAVGSALSGMDTLQAASAATSAIVMLFPEGYAGEAEDLEPLQREFLQKLASTRNPWFLGDSPFANFGLTMGDFGLPPSMEELQEWLG